MNSFRRSAFLFLAPGERQVYDLHSVLRGERAVHMQACMHAVSPVCATEYSISDVELSILTCLSATDWMPVEDICKRFDIGETAIWQLAEFGLLISDREESPFTDFRRRDEDLTRFGWNKYAALQYSMSRWRDVDAMRLTAVDYPNRHALEEASRLEFNKNSMKHGPPPGHFADYRSSNKRVALTARRAASPLQQLFALRETSRDFDSDRPVTQEQLSTILYQAFGCHGYYELADDFVILKKTSPSGGSLHPTEVYPFIQNVEGIETGLYHYSVREHALELIKTIPAERANRFAVEFTAGQEHFRNAHVLLILTSRFGRHNWKYRNHDKAYRVVLLEAGHLSQSVYLLCAELGLGAFITGAINEKNIEDELAIDGISEGVVGVLGFGVRSSGDEKLSPPFHDYQPGKTSV